MPLLIFVGYFIWHFATTPKRQYENNMKLLYSDINGRITKIKSDRGTAKISLSNRNGKISISGIRNDKGSREFFLDHIKVNDSIYSPYGSDSIYVISSEGKKGFKMHIDYAN